MPVQTRQKGLVEFRSREHDVDVDCFVSFHECSILHNRIIIIDTGLQYKFYKREPGKDKINGPLLLLLQGK